LALIIAVLVAILAKAAFEVVAERLELKEASLEDVDIELDGVIFAKFSAALAVAALAAAIAAFAEFKLF
jgi:hypothetical protein